MSPSKERRQQMRAFEDQALKGLDEMFKLPPTRAELSAERTSLLDAFEKTAPAQIQEVFREVAVTAADKSDNEITADLFRAFHARGIDSFTPGDHSIPVVRALSHPDV